MSEHPAELLRPPGDERPQRELFISCLEQRTLPPTQIPPSPPPFHMSANVIILSFVRGAAEGWFGGGGLCVLAERAG